MLSQTARNLPACLAGMLRFTLEFNFRKSEQNNSGVYKITEEKRDALSYVTLSHSHSGW